VRSDRCKICGSERLNVVAHTAKCSNCGVLLCYPYPEVRETGYLSGKKELRGEERVAAQASSLDWHIRSGARNHHNFTNMALFALSDEERKKPLNVLDYGGGGGQFSLVQKSLFPKSDVWIVDMNDEWLLDAYRPLNKQIKFKDFPASTEKFDVIFLNDVFEHVTDPVGVLSDLRSRLVPRGKVFIDTPCEFWLYPMTRFFSRKIHTQLLKGTVDYDHQQIWTRKSFETVAQMAGMKVQKCVRLSEYTQPASFYMKNMGISHPLVWMAGTMFFALSPFIARNKIMATLVDED
jgi:2-polyprenyl-3-methyl-5-hydroxy-6-metoxy-1,4-benzoquinol methylase